MPPLLPEAPLLLEVLELAEVPLLAVAPLGVLEVESSFAEPAVDSGVEAPVPPVVDVYEPSS